MSVPREWGSLAPPAPGRTKEEATGRTGRRAWFTRLSRPAPKCKCPEIHRLSLRREKRDLGNQFAPRPVTHAHPDLLAFVQLPDLAPPQGLHMDEDVRRAGPAGDETITLGAVEPADHRLERCATRLGDIARLMPS